MEKTLIATDSASDISEEIEKELGIKILPFTIMIGEQSYISRKDFTPEGFYDLMAEHDEIPKTSQITPFEFQEFYLEAAKAGYTDVVLVLINSQGSSTFANSLMAKDLFFEEYPEYEGKIHFYNYDGMGYSAQYGQPVIEAAKMVKEGKALKEILEYLTYELPRRKVYFGMYTLKYAGKSGRIPSAAAFVGDRLNLKPIMKIYHNQLVTGAKVRGEVKIIPRMVELTIADMEPGTPYSIIYGNEPSAAKAAEELMRDITGYGPEGYYPIGAAVAANAGPRTVGIAFHVKDEFENEGYKPQ
ncbi:MAG: DegV family protein [Lachnospiraceae bacterium]|nr:DegV family protein [Lachnospiraceae bacterium]